MIVKAIKYAVASGSLICTMAGALAAVGDPTAQSLAINGQSSSSFMDYTMSEPFSMEKPVGIGSVDTNALFYIKENTGTYQGQRVQSWYIFFDPSCVGVVDATLSFSTAIVGIDRTGTAPAWDLANVPLSTVNYIYRAHTGLEKRDSINTTQVDNDTLHIRWKAGDPGDHIRVYTVAHAPEPETYALMLAGLGVLGAVARRRARSIPA